MDWKNSKQMEEIKVKHLVDNSKYYQIGDGDHSSIKPEMYVESGIPYSEFKTYLGMVNF